MDDLQEWLREEEKQENVSKELFNKDDIKVKTEVNNEEIKAIAKINFICDYLELKRFPNMVKEFLELRVSHKRKSRGEFIKSLQERASRNMGGFFGGGMGGNKGFQ